MLNGFLVQSLVSLLLHCCIYFNWVPRFKHRILFLNNILYPGHAIGKRGSGDVNVHVVGTS